MLWLLDVPWEERRDAQWAGAYYDARHKCWAFEGESLPHKLERWAAPRHSWPHWRQDDLNRTWSYAHQDDTVRLRPHQQDAAVAMLAAWQANRPGFLLADQTGLGKTYSTIAGINAIAAHHNVLVLCPLSVVAHWRRSIDALGGTNRWAVVNYDRAKQLLEAPSSAQSAKRARTKNKRIATKGTSLVRWDIVVCDEAHLLKNPQSQRSAAVRQLIKGTGGEPAWVVWASATAGQTPLELAYLAPLLADVTGSKVRDLADFEQWCRDVGLGVKRGRFGSWEWERNPADLDLMRDLLFAGSPPAGLRRRPSDIAGWPELQRVAWPVELDASDRSLYEEAWEEFRAALALAQTTGDDSTNPLVLALRFRQKASLLRVGATVDMVTDLVGDNLAVAVSVEFHDTAAALVEQLARRRIRAVVISGREGAAEREENRVAFQRGEADVCVFTVREGISLHANEAAIGASDRTRALVCHDLRWSALAMAQIEGRCHRDGQDALAYWMFADGTVEQRVAEVLLGRMEDMSQMHGDDTGTLDAIAAVITDV